MMMMMMMMMIIIILFPGCWNRVSDVSEEHAASVFRVEISRVTVRGSINSRSQRCTKREEELCPRSVSCEERQFRVSKLTRNDRQHVPVQRR